MAVPFIVAEPLYLSSDQFKGYLACSRPRQVWLANFFPLCSLVNRHYQIVTTNHKREKSPITREKLAYEVAKCIEVYLAELKVCGQEHLVALSTDLRIRRTGPPTLSASKTCS